ncbi:hypothetical protein NC651_011379 [Populus alba x Populus x berolinensis]|nr:hypothetical protein NC651_011379 [Populus alba x Populus x berolinensis]
MIRNIPNRYTYLVLHIALSLSPLLSMTIEGFFSSSSLSREMLMEFLDSHCMKENEKAKLQNSDSTKETIVSAFDFLCLPVDLNHSYLYIVGFANKGYAFVNFTATRAAWKFCLSAKNQAWDVFQSNRIREIACARIQGKEQLVKRFEK